jgi:hypothetical protein
LAQTGFFARFQGYRTILLFGLVHKVPRVRALHDMSVGVDDEIPILAVHGSPPLRFDKSDTSGSILEMSIRAGFAVRFSPLRWGALAHEAEQLEKIRRGVAREAGLRSAQDTSPKNPGFHGRFGLKATRKRW